MLKAVTWFLYACAALLVFVFVTNASIYLISKPYIHDTASTTPYAQVALIPGAPVYESGRLTPIFADRVEQAITLYQNKKVSKILVSGDNSDVTHNEVDPVRTYLLEKGIPNNDIYLDHAGFDTYSTMYRAKEIFGVSSMLISSQSFHLPRAVFLGRSLGIEAYGVRADVGRVLPQNYVREVFANEKALLDLLFKTKPKFLGPQIPIGESGDGL